MSAFQIGPGVLCDLDILVNTKLLIQANSGGGKSWALRRVLEQTHGAVQQLVIDPEGEFSTLRQRFDYVLAARQGGDTLADPRTAKLLAERLLELGVSAVLDIYELKAHERIRFVRLFCEALVDAPKALWHPVLVVLDEAHVYAPQVGEAESAGAVKDLATRGRKRGFCLVPATQRLSKLHKDVAAECNNKLIGRTALDVDMDRAGDELGFTKAARQDLRSLEAGEFFAYGPALSRLVVKVRVGSVQTEHPRAGGTRQAVAPAPSARVLAILSKLADLPAEADERAKTLEDLKRENATLKRDLTIAKKAQPVVTEFRVEVPVVGPETLAALREQVSALTTIAQGVMAALQTASAVRPREAMPPPPRQAVPTPARPVTRTSVSQDSALGKCERAILRVLACYPDGCESGRLTLLSGYRFSGGFKNALATLRTEGYMEGANTGVMRITETGLSALGSFDPLPQGDALAQYWLSHVSFGKCERAILQALLDHPRGLDKDRLCEVTNYEFSGGFKNALANLRTAGVLIGRNMETMSVHEDLRG